ncbi:M23 family metallopeptidase [Deinococcus hopiensis]|uniref:Membrane proteins related to metalloendopeptidases n=1 Tax=Deinococcus hopiensis KR-140 TaxID=695939 RepID=A0A1W1UK50_9DEIO|nr:M23 family metallopeptidase [Deinococcus hopiensis]SMB81393.1 Membrane proteins related to metalloendopeptidases [Deinococcus hopiensis KR-140]
MSQAARLRTLLEAPSPEDFAPSFLEQVKFEQVQQGLAGLRRQHGAVQDVRESHDEAIWTVEAERGQYQVLARLNGQLQVTALRIPTPSMTPLQARVAFGALWLLPLILIQSVARGWAAPTQLDWLTTVIPSVIFGGALLATTVWAQSSTLLRPVFWLCMSALLSSAVRLPALSTGTINPWEGLFALAMSLLFGRLLLGGLKGRRIPSSLVPLGPVLAGGTFMVGQGGSTPTVNYHVDHPAMRYAVDFIGVGALGRHARGHLPADPSRYAIFGAQVLAPLDGEVLRTQEARPDLQIPRADALHPAGNFIVLRSTVPDGRTVHVLLAHLQQGSVRVRPGDRVRAGQVLATVGNSGNTTEPHLHLGVNIGATEEDPFSGEGVPFSVQGRFPVRGMTFRLPDVRAADLLGPSPGARASFTGGRSPF